MWIVASKGLFLGEDISDKFGSFRESRLVRNVFVRTCSGVLLSDIRVELVANWNFSDLSTKYTFSGFSFVFSLIGNNRDCLCLK